MRKTLALIVFATGIASLSAHVFAKGPGGMSGGGTHGPVYQSMPSQATSNANAPWTGTQEKGLERAQERMSDQGLLNEKATQNQDRREQRPQAGHPSR